jgi:hypothetical protein
MAGGSSLSLLEALSSVPDPRARNGLRHPLAGVLGLLCVATMCGCRSVYAALQWGRDHGRGMAEKLGLGRHGIPTDGMMSNLLRRLDKAAFEAALKRWAAARPADARAQAEGVAAAAAPGGPAIPGGIADVVNVDGKTLRGARGHEAPGVHLLAAYSARLGLVLAQESAGANKEDGGEVTAVPALLEGLVLNGKVVTGDAPHAQRELCRLVTDDRREGGSGDYLLTVKENQPTLHAAAADVFRFPSPGPGGGRAPLLPRPGPATRTSTGRGSSVGPSRPAASWPGGTTGRG